VYEVHGAWDQDAYHLIMFAFLADARVALPASATTDHGVGEIIQDVPAAVRPHPTVVRILNDADVADFDPTEFDTALAAHGISNAVPSDQFPAWTS
jgi:8-oxo-dGTP diphosphatase